jgi:hypothetical protein
MHTRRTGTLRSTVNGPRYQHHNIWLTPFSQKYISELASLYNLDENHVIGLIVDRFSHAESPLESELEFFADVEIKNVLGKEKFENG